MGMGYSADFAVTIEKGILEKIGLASYDNFIKTLKSEGVDLSEFAVFAQDEDLSYITIVLESDDEIAKGLVEKGEYTEIDNVTAAYLKFVREFEDKYNMRIHLNYHDCELYGDRYDDVDGAYYSIDFYDIFTETDEAKKFQEDAGFSHYEISRFVTFG